MVPRLAGVTVVPPPPPSPSSVPESFEPERHAAQARLESAVGDGRLTLDEFTDRCGRVWAATAPGELVGVLDDLPVPVVGQTASARSTIVCVIGDARRRGRWSLRPRTTAWLLLGDLDLDLRGALTTGGDIEIAVYSVLGDVTVTAPEGVEVELGGFTLLGDHKIDLAAVPRVPGTPTVRVRVYSLLGDTAVRSAR